MPMVFGAGDDKPQFYDQNGSFNDLNGGSKM